MSITLTLEQTDYMDRINANYVKISELLKPYSSEYSGVMNWAKKFENRPTRQDYMDILRFRRADKIMPFHRFEYQKFQECGKAERTLDFKYVFTQLIVEYPETEATLKEWSEKTKYEKEVRRNNAEINQALVALEGPFVPPLQVHRPQFGDVTADNRVAVDGDNPLVMWEDLGEGRPDRSELLPLSPQVRLVEILPRVPHDVMHRQIVKRIRILGERVHARVRIVRQERTDGCIEVLIDLSAAEIDNVHPHPPQLSGK